MKVNDILMAKGYLGRLNEIKFNDFSLAYKVYNLIKKANEILEMVGEEKKKIVDLYTKKDENGNPLIENNQYTFDNDENQQKFIEDTNNLRNTDINDIEKIDISIKAIQHASDFSSDDLMALSAFVNWLD